MNTEQKGLALKVHNDGNENMPKWKVQKPVFCTLDNFLFVSCRKSRVQKAQQTDLLHTISVSYTNDLYETELHLRSL